MISVSFLAGALFPTGSFVWQTCARDILKSAFDCIQWTSAFAKAEAVLLPVCSPLALPLPAGFSPLLIRQVNSHTRDTHDRSHSTRFSRTPPLRKTFHVQGLHASETSGVFRSRSHGSCSKIIVLRSNFKLRNRINRIFFLKQNTKIDNI